MGMWGKSSLFQRLAHNRYVASWNSTHGISLEQYPKDWGKKGIENKVHPYLLNLWDFGGQDIYHATHRLFMQVNAVYLLLWDNSTEQAPYTVLIENGMERQYINHKLPYWLSYVNSQGKDSPVIVVQTKVGRDGRKIDYPREIEKLYSKRFSSLNFHCIESSDDNWEENGYNELLEIIRREASRIKSKAEIPYCWSQVRQKIRRLQIEGKKRLELKDFYNIANEVENPQDLITWLTQSGVCFYKEGLFNDEIILDQAWAIEGIYTLFDRQNYYYALEDNDGEFSGNELKRIWKENSEAEQELFISFMLSCELCFETTPEDLKHFHTPFSERTFVVPQLLPSKEEKPELLRLIKYAWQHRSPLFFRFESELLHYGVIQSLIVRVRTQEWAQKIGIWKTGILLEKGREIIQLDASDRRVDVKASPGSNSLTSKILKELRDLLGESAREFVSIDGHGFALLSDLEDQVQMDNVNVAGYWGENLDRGSSIPVDNLKVFLGQPSLGEVGRIRELEEDNFGAQQSLGEVEDRIRELEEDNFEMKPLKPVQSPELKLPPKDLPRVYFSYDWGGPEEGSGNSREDFVDALYEAMQKEDDRYLVLRDKMNLNYEGLISEFMKELGKGDLIIVFISDKYIRSPYCMWELYEIGRNCKFDKNTFSQTILPISVERLRLHDPLKLESYFEHWEKEKNNWQGFVSRQMVKGNVSRAQWDRYQKTQEIERIFGDLADWLIDINASSLNLLEENDFQLVKDALNKRLSEKLENYVTSAQFKRDITHSDIQRKLSTAKWMVNTYNSAYKKLKSIYLESLRTLLNDEDIYVRKETEKAISERLGIGDELKQLLSTNIHEKIKVSLIEGGGMLIGNKQLLLLEIQNIGNENLRQLNIEILEAAEFNVVSQRSVTIQSIKPEESCSLEFIIFPGPEAFGGFSISYKINKQVAKSSIKINAIFNNPYVYGPPIENENLFIGRERILSEIKQGIIKPTKQDIFLVGERRTGKTSILYNIKNNLHVPFVPVFLSFNTSELTTKAILEDVFESINQTLLEYKIIEEPSLNVSFQPKEFINLLHQLLLRAKTRIPDLKIILLLDEADYLLNVRKENTGIRSIPSLFKKQGKIDELIQNILRTALQSSKIGKDLRAVVAGTSVLATYVSKGSSPFFNHFKLLFIKPLNNNEIRELIIKPLRGFEIGFTKAAIDKILKICGGQPYYCQAICYEAFNRALDENSKEIGIEQVNFSENKILENLYDSFRSYFWNRMNRQEKIFLTKIIKNQPKSKFPKRRATRLIEWGLIHESENRYEFSGDLIKKWTIAAIENYLP